MKVGPGCDHCYAESDAKRFGHDIWGSGKQRRHFGDKHWNEPRKWNRKAKEAGHRMRVFCGSMCDIFDNEIEQKHRDRLWELAQECDWITWQFLTKRIGNAKDMLPAMWLRDGMPDHCWLGATVVNQEEAERDIKKLVAVKARIHWLSIEPQLGPVDITNKGIRNGYSRPTSYNRGVGIEWTDPGDDVVGVDWVITGGESGPKSRVRPYNLRWPLQIIEMCRKAKVACFVKQLGSNPIGHNGTVPFAVDDYKGANPEEWPEYLRVQEFPDVR